MTKIIKFNSALNFHEGISVSNPLEDVLSKIKGKAIFAIEDEPSRIDDIIAQTVLHMKKEADRKVAKYNEKWKIEQGNKK